MRAIASGFSLVSLTAAAYLGAMVLSGTEGRSASLAEPNSESVVSVRGGESRWLRFRHARVVADADRATPGSSVTKGSALAYADLDRDGAPDLLVGAHDGNGGKLLVHRGNPDAYAPKDNAVFVRMQNGFDPLPFLDATTEYAVPEPVDFLAIGDFDKDGFKDALTARRGGGMYLLRGDGTGSFLDAQKVSLPGTVTAMASGEFRAADGWTDVAIGIETPDGATLLMYDGAAGLLVAAPIRFPLTAQAEGVAFGDLDGDPFTDLAVAAGSEVEIIHGWGRKQTVRAQARTERLPLAFDARDLAVGYFIWNREAAAQIAVLGDGGTIRILQRGELNTLPFSEAEISERARRRLRSSHTASDVEAALAWSPAESKSWKTARELPTADRTAKTLMRSHLGFLETDDLIALRGEDAQLDIVRQIDSHESGPLGERSATAEMARAIMDLPAGAAAALAMPQKVNGVRNLVVVQEHSTALIVVALGGPSITVDRTDDPSGAGLTAASACTGSSNDCSLRGAVQFANANAGTTINLGTNTYVLSISGANGCVNENATTGNTIGDLEINLSTTLVGQGAGNTIIRQAAATNDRVICMNVSLAPNLTYSFSALTITGGRDVNSNVGGGGFIGGAKNTTLNLTNVTFANNQTTGPNISGGGGVAVTGGNMNVTNCTFGAANLPGTNRNSLTLGNASNSNSGGGLSYSPGDPLGISGATGTLTITGTTFTHNTSSSVAAGGGGLVVFNFNVSSGTANISTSTFSNNQATGTASGGGIMNESFTVNVSTTSFISNAAANRGGGIYVGGGSLLLDGTTAGITFTGNTATTAGSSVSTGSATNVSGTNTSIGGDIEVTTNGTWTNNAGSTLAPTNVVITGGTFICNNSTMNVGGNLTIEPGTVGGTFNANSATVNIAGNFTLKSGGSGPVTSFNAGTSAFTFNGSGAQTLGTTLSPTFNSLTVNKSAGTLTLGVNTLVGTNMTVTSGTFDLAAFTANRSSAGGTLTVSNGAMLKASNAFPANFTTVSLGPTSTVEYAGGGGETIVAVNYGHLTSSGAGARTLASSGTIGVAGTFTPGSNTYANTGSTINFNGSGAQSVPAFNYNNLTTSNPSALTLASSGTVGIAGVFTAGSNSYVVTGSTVEYKGSSAQTLPTAFTTYNKLTLNNAAGTAGFSGLISQGLLRVQAGTFTSGGTFSDVQIDSGTTLASSAATTINVAGSWTNGGTFTASTGTVSFNGGSAQTLGGTAATTFNNLTIDNASGASLSTADATVNGTLTLTSGAFGVASRLLTLNSTVSTSSGSVTSAAAGTVNYNQGTNGQSVAPGTYGNLTLSNFTKTLPSSGTVKIAGTFTTGAAGGHTVTGSTVEFNGSSGQTLPANFPSYNNLTLNNAAGATEAGNVSVAGTLTLTSGALAVGANILTLMNAVAGTATNLNAGSTSSIVIAGSGAGVNLPSNVTSLTSLTLNNTNGTTLQANLALTGTLTLTSGIVTTGANTLSLSGAATSTRTSGYVNGSLKKTYSAPGSFTYFVGTANGYSPAAATITAGTGDLTVKATQSAHPNVNAPTSLHRYWTLTGTGVTASLVFTYLDPTDIFGAEASYRIVRATGGSPVFFANSCPSTSCVDTAANTATVSGVSTFSNDWTLAENADLSVAKSAPALGVAGDASGFDYTVTVANNGPAAYAGGLSIADTLPAGTTFSAAGSDAGCSAIGQAVTCTSAVTLANAGTKIFIIHVTIPASIANGTSLSNSATVSSTGTDDGNATNNASNTVVTSVFGAPVGLVATASSTSLVGVTWSVVASADHYEVWRSSNNNAYALAGSPVSASFPDSAVTGGTTYLYAVRAVTSTGKSTPFSTIDPATTILFTNDPLAAGSTIVQAQHLTEVRTAVDAFRASTGLSGGTYTNASPAGVVIQAVHIQQLRTAIDAARSALGLPTISYTDPVISAGSTVVQAAHIQQIRDGVK